MNRGGLLILKNKEMKEKSAKKCIYSFADFFLSCTPCYVKSIRSQRLANHFLPDLVFIQRAILPPIMANSTNIVVMKSIFLSF